ncbi:hypothetical protein [Streptomyces collinus]|uniref:hypothetical protein n=1 Tax=Streptomyces collinus TaxID=42684 RepID=UPI00362BCE11
MTTATAVAGRPLSGWSHETPLGTRYVLLPARPGEQALGALRVDRALLVPEGTRERLAAAVLATARLRLPGALGTVDLVAEAGEVWLLTDRPPAPTLADVLSAGAPGPDAGSAASVLNETVQTLLALHGAGLAHGSLGPATVVLAPNGTALLTETGLATVLGDAAVLRDAAPPHPGHQAADTGAPRAGHRVADTIEPQAGHRVGDSTAPRAGHRAGDSTAPRAGHRAGDSTAPFAMHQAGDTTAPHAMHQAGDTTAWAALARTLAAAWTAPSTPAAELFAHCATTAESQGLAAARAALLSGRSTLPTDFLRRTALRTAASASTPTFTSPRPPQPVPAAEPPDPRSPRAPQQRPAAEPPESPDLTSARAPRPGPAAEPPESPDGMSAWAPRRHLAAEPGESPHLASQGTPQSRPAAEPPDSAHLTPARTPQTPPAAASPRPPHPTDPRRTPVPSVVADPARTGSVSDRTPAPSTMDRAAQSSAPGDRTPPAAAAQWATPVAGTGDAERLTGVGHGHPPVDQDAQATVLGKRNRPASTPARDGEEPGEILLRFGPGVPVAEQDALRARWRGAEAVTAPARRRRRRGGLVTAAVLAVAAVLLWLLLRPDPAPAVLAVRVQAPAGVLHCGKTADLVGVVTTDGRGGPVTYRWLRGDGQDSGELVHLARRGERRVRVHLRWTVRGPGRFRGTARLRVADQRAPVEARGGFTYACP